MRLKFLLLFMLIGIGFLKAQDTIKTLIISEARMDASWNAYFELTNMGTDTLDLSKFEVGRISPWDAVYIPGTGNWMMLPKKKLAPGKSFLVAKVSDYTHKMWLKNPQDFQRNGAQPELAKLADIQIHVSETSPQKPQSIDSVSTYNGILGGLWNGRDLIYVRYHNFFNNVRDSIVVDQIGGVFDNAGHNFDKNYDVAGISDATWSRILVRKSSVKKGNLDFAHGRGTNLTESEWIPLPILGSNYTSDRAVLWTAGNHGNFHLSSLQSSSITLKWTDSTLTVPWGVRNDDSLMYQFKRVPGMGWWYDYSKSHNDSAYVSVRTGDLLTVYACGDKMEKAILKITALPPTTDDNLVIPLKPKNNQGYYTGSQAFCEVSNKVPIMDTIFNFPYGTPTDTLTKYLEKPAKATWKYIFADGLAKRANLKTGDKLEVTSESGRVKTYYIKTRNYWPSHNAFLSAITWPDIPAYYKGVFGWNGDTIPNFVKTGANYQVKIPWDVNGTPALVSKTEDLNAKLKVNRALNLVGTVDDRTVTFNTTAEDDTSKRAYNVELIKEKNPANVQPWIAEPFISQFVWHQDYANDFIEIINPGTAPLDLSNYMVSCGYFTTVGDGITRVSATGDFNNRYNKYIPGRKWVSRALWSSTPATVEKDPDSNVNPVVLSGDVFVLGDFQGIMDPARRSNALYARAQEDIDLKYNPWHDTIASGQGFDQWSGSKFFLYKILNDSVKNGLKKANDPKDFKLIDAWGDVDGAQWKVGNVAINQQAGFIRKPSIYKGNPNINDYSANKGSFGSDANTSEWLDRSVQYWYDHGFGWPNPELNVAAGLGVHVMDEVTFYKSTIKSTVYKVSEGYSNKETVRGIISGTTVTKFLTNIIKADTGQHLKFKSFANGSIYAGSGVLLKGDSLIVLSRDSSNTTKYILDVTLNGLSRNDTLTSKKYAISITGNTGKVSGIAFNTDLKSVVDSVKLPPFASMNVIDVQNAYVPLQTLNFDTMYVKVKATDQIQFEVTAEDGASKIVYKLQPNATDSDAYVISSVYSVDQIGLLIGLLPSGTTRDEFFSNLTPAPGATIKLFDKFGLERTFGYVSLDDILQVTASNGKTTKSYYLVMLGLKAQYLAYVLSSSYSVDQLGLKIAGKGITGSLTVSAFIAKLTPATGATVKVLDKQGNVKTTTANLAKGDVVQVTSGNGVNVVIYTITMDPTSVSTINNNRTDVEVYPNPTAGFVNVSGVEPGNRICIFNMVGELVLEKIALQEVETVSLNKLSQGVYFVKIVAKGKQEACLKLILK